MQKPPLLRYLCWKELSNGYQGTAAGLARKVECSYHTAYEAVRLYNLSTPEDIQSFLDSFERKNKRSVDPQPQPEEKPVRGFRTPYNVLKDRDRMFITRY